eukprot:3100187-Pleurochrysis_carterae.AAC.2
MHIGANEECGRTFVRREGPRVVAALAHADATIIAIRQHDFVIYSSDSRPPHMLHASSMSAASSRHRT